MLQNQVSIHEQIWMTASNAANVTMFTGIALRAIPSTRRRQSEKQSPSPYQRRRKAAEEHPEPLGAIRRDDGRPRRAVRVARRVRRPRCALHARLDDVERERDEPARDAGHGARGEEGGPGVRGERGLDLGAARGGGVLGVRGVRARPVAQGGLVGGEVGAVADVAERGRGEAAVEAAEAVRAPDVEDDGAVGEGGGGWARAGGGADEGLLVDLDQLGWGRY